MSEDSGEKKYAASQKKLQDQRKKGQVAQSQDIGKLLVLAVISEIALLMAQNSLEQFGQLLMLPVSLVGQPFSRSLQVVVTWQGYRGDGYVTLQSVWGGDGWQPETVVAEADGQAEEESEATTETPAESLPDFVTDKRQVFTRIHGQ